MAVTEALPRRRRVARLSLLAVALIGLTLILLVAAAWIATREDPGDTVGRLPLGADDNVPSFSLILVVGAAMAGVFVGCGRSARGGGDAGARPRPADSD